jgi:heat shock protein HslJ
MKRTYRRHTDAARAAMALILGACASGVSGSGQRVDTTAAAAEPGSPALAGTKWRLEDLAGKGVVDRAQATLEFTGDGFASGKGSCNQFRGPVTVSGETIAFGPLVATRMFCGDAVSNQETAYLAALDAAERWEIKEPFLYIYAAGSQEPLRFIRE